MDIQIYADQARKAEESENWRKAYGFYAEIVAYLNRIQSDDMEQISYYEMKMEDVIEKMRE